MTRVVIAEDEAIIRMDLRELLEEEGYHVVGETGRGDEVETLVESLAPEVAILDVKMPGLDGIEVARRLVENRRCATVLLTAFSQREFVDSARAAGVMAYLVKPFQRNDLVPAIEMARARFADLLSLEERARIAEERLETRKVIDRAKGLLQDKRSMSENDAFRLLQTTAMAERRSMRSVAQDVIDGTLPGDG